MLSWRDGVEILFFATLFYFVLRWLYKHRLSPLAHYAIAYCALVIGAHQLQLSCIAHFLIEYGPVIVMLFIVFHEHILQKNFVILTRSALQSAQCNTWPEIIVRLSLHRGSNNASTICIVDKQAQATPFLVSPSAINAYLTQELADILTNHNHLGMIWLDASTGKLHTTQAQWNTYAQPGATSTSHAEWYSHALALTSTTDTIVFCIGSHQSSFTFFAKGKIQHNVPAHQLLSLLRKESSKPYHVGGSTYGAHREHSL
jgi:hypothetical protein